MLRRMSVRWPQPDAQCSQTVGVETRSNGRERKRYFALVRAPNRADLHGVAGEVAGVERLVARGAHLLLGATRSMNRSPAIYSAKRVQRARDAALAPVEQDLGPTR